MSQPQHPTPISSEQKRLYAEKIREFADTFQKGNCVVCGNPAIRSHTISRSTYLNEIEEKYHVLQWRHDWWSPDVDGCLDLRPIGLSDASTFPGYCGDHDRDYFKPVDCEAFLAKKDQLFLQAYRAHVRELHCKRSQLAMIPDPAFIAKLGGFPNPEAFTHSGLGLLRISATEAGLRDTILHHQKLESIRASGDYGRMEHCVIILTGVPPFIACAGSFFPEILPDGSILQDFANIEACLETVHFSILPTATGTIVVFSFLDTEDFAPRQLVRAILEHPRRDDLVIWVAFAYIENTMLRPSWWTGLPQSMKDATRDAFDHNVDLQSQESLTIDALPDAFVTGLKIQNHFWI